MSEEIQKPIGVPLTFQKQPDLFLVEVGNYLETMQLVYRVKLPQQELVLWRETLKDYSYQEFNQAMTHLISNPPKYQLDDGSIQVWRGMPKLPDVVDVMLDAREQVIHEANQRESEQRRREWMAMEKRREEHPEEFMSWQDFCKQLAEDKPLLAAKLGMNMPVTELDFDKNRKFLREQAERLKGE